MYELKSIIFRLVFKPVSDLRQLLRAGGDRAAPRVLQVHRREKPEYTHRYARRRSTHVAYGRDSSTVRRVEYDFLLSLARRDLIAHIEARRPSLCRIAYGPTNGSRNLQAPSGCWNHFTTRCDTIHQRMSIVPSTCAHTPPSSSGMLPPHHACPIPLNVNRGARSSGATRSSRGHEARREASGRTIRIARGHPGSVTRRSARRVSGTSRRPLALGEHFRP